MEQPEYHLEHVLQSKQDVLEDFQGPLDVILLLLSKNKIQIQDIQISVILEQYLAYLDEMKQMDMEITSDFITMASHLMYIKSKMLLSYSDRVEALSEMEILIQSLEERRRQEAFEQIHIAMDYLQERNEIGLGTFVKPQEPLPKTRSYQYKHELKDLYGAFLSISERSEKKIPPPVKAFRGIVGKEPFPVAKKAAQILKKLIAKGKTGFVKLFADSRSRSEVVATFLAILELCKVHSIHVAEPEKDGEFPSVEFIKIPDQLTTDESEVSSVGTK